MTPSGSVIQPHSCNPNTSEVNDFCASEVSLGHTERQTDQHTDRQITNKYDLGYIKFSECAIFKCY